MSRDENDVDMSLVLSILQGNSSIPAILHDEKSGRMESHNIRLPKEDTATLLREKMVQFSRRHEPVRLNELDQTHYFADSNTLKLLQLFPFIQFFVFALFVALAFFALNRSQRAEQISVCV